MITQIDPRELPGRATSYNNPIHLDVKEFLDSGWDVAEVKIEKYATVHSACCAYRAAARRLAPDDIIVTERSGRLFLMRK